jgi:hypothetical protein
LLASCTAASNTALSTTRPSPGPTVPNRNFQGLLDIYSRGMSTRRGSFRLSQRSSVCPIRPRTRAPRTGLFVRAGRSALVGTGAPVIHPALVARSGY